MRIAFFGGSFDPPHCGHLAIAQAAASRLQLDVILFAPVGAQPHKLHDPAPAAFADRVEMVRLAAIGHRQFQISRIDAPREDGQPNYTFHVLTRLKASLGVDDTLFCLLGADSFLALPKWYAAADLLFTCDFIVAGRPGFSLDHVAAALPRGVQTVNGPQPHAGNSILFNLADAESIRHSRLYLLPDLREDVSATQIRSALAADDGDEGDETVLPAAVVAYIHAHRLYS